MARFKQSVLGEKVITLYAIVDANENGRIVDGPFNTLQNARASLTSYLKTGFYNSRTGKYETLKSTRFETVGKKQKKYLQRRFVIMSFVYSLQHIATPQDEFMYSPVKS